MPFSSDFSYKVMVFHVMVHLEREFTIRMSFSWKILLNTNFRAL